MKISSTGYLREHLPGLVQSIAVAFIRTAKDEQITPDMLHSQLEHSSLPLPLAEMGAAMYADYQRALLIGVLSISTILSDLLYKR